MVVDIIKVFIL